MAVFGQFFCKMYFKYVGANDRIEEQRGNCNQIIAMIIDQWPLDDFPMSGLRSKCQD